MAANYLVFGTDEEEPGSMLSACRSCIKLCAVNVQLRCGEDPWLPEVYYTNGG